MTEQKQIKKASKAREEYSKFKPFADDLRKAEKLVRIGQCSEVV